MTVKLAENIYKDVDKIPTRFGYGDGLLKLGEMDERVVVLGADLSSSLRVDLFKDAYPDRFIQTGIAEQDMMCLAKVGSGHGGISVGADGATHQALEDIAITRVVPGVTVIVPCDYHETVKATIAAAQIEGPVVIRFGREKVPVITTPETPFKVGRAEIYREGEDVTVVACGVMVYEALIAAEMLAQEGISTQVINCHTVKPIDKETLIEAARKTKAVVTAEEHQVMGGFGSAVAEVLSQDMPVPMRVVGVQDTFGQSGAPDDLMKAYGLKAENIVQAAKEVIKIKRGG